MTPRLAEILARMVEAVLEAEDSAAGRGNITGPRERVPAGRGDPEGSKRHTAKEARR